MDQTNLPVILLGFDGSPVYDDTAVLNRWLDVTEKDKNSRSATFYNTLPLHDGNHYPASAKQRITTRGRKNSLMNWTPSLLNWRNRVVK